MRAIVQDRFGPPETWQLTDAPPPEPGPDDVLVRVHAAALNPYDWHMVRGDPYIARLSPTVGHGKPSARVAGVDGAGTVEAVGSRVQDWQVGDEVFGLLRGSLAEYACANATNIAAKPVALNFEQAAAVPMAATTALRGLRDVADVHPGQRILVNGAGGGIGTFAVQYAAGLGADVTGVCSAGNRELVHSLGAKRVVDYAAQDFTRAGAQYDVILDNVSNRPLRHLRRALTPTGTLVVNGGGSPGRVFGGAGAVARAVLLDRMVRQRIRPIPTTFDAEQLNTVAGLIDTGVLNPVVGRTYPLDEAAEGLRYVEQGHARGKVVVTVA